MLETEKWAHGKPKEFASIAQQLVLSAESFYRIAHDFYDDGFCAKDLTSPSLKKWHSYYKKHREISLFFAEMLSAFYPSKTVEFSQIDKVFQSQKTTSHVHSHELTELINEHGEDFFRLSFDEVISNFSIENLSKEEQKKHVEIFSNPKMKFFINISIVCNVFYGDEPGLLLRKARLGDLDALEKILRLDETMISEPGIARQLYKLKSEGRRVQHLKLMECLGKRPKIKFSRRKIKYVLAGRIYGLAKECDYKLTMKELRKLFDAVYKDTGHEEDDLDLPVCPDDFKKGVEIERKA